METSLQGKVALVTGANTGIGRVTAEQLAARGAEVLLTARSQSKIDPVITSIRARDPKAKVHFVPLELGSLAKVRAAAQQVLDADRPLDLLINNAGMAGRGGTTQDGFQLTFGVNHLGPFLFTQLLLPRVVDGGRVVNVASRAHYNAEAVDWDLLKQPVQSPTGMAEYSVSKLCNVLHAKALATRLEDRGITTYSLHPGVVATDVWRQIPWPFRTIAKWFMISEDEGAQTTLHCATSDEAGSETGLYYDECAPKKPSRLARDEALAEELYERSEAWISAP